MAHSVRELLRKKASITRTDYGGECVEFGGKTLNMSKKFEELTDEEVIKVAEMVNMDTKTGKSTAKGVTVGKPCECGCGELTSGPKRKFKQGHDMRLKSRLRKAAGDGDKKAQAELKRRGW